MTGKRPNKHEIGLRIIRARRKLGMTQTQLTNASGVKHGCLSRIENGGTYMTIDTLVALCAALGKKADWLLFGDGTDEVAALAKMDAVKRCPGCKKVKKKTQFFCYNRKMSACCKPCHRERCRQYKAQRKGAFINFCSNEMDRLRDAG